jgi:hypothetical protein
LPEEYVRTTPEPTYYFIDGQGARENSRHQLKDLLGNLESLIST